MRTDGWQDRVNDAALSWEETPYMPHANVKGVGVDCGHFIRQVYEAAGFGPFPPQPRDYPADWAMHSDSERYLDFILPFVREVQIPITGGFCLMHVGLAYSHSAILLKNGNYIHAWGRLRGGRVMQSQPRLIKYLAHKSGFPLRHFEPK